MGVTKRFKAGETLFSRGEQPGAMYVLLEGRLAVFVGEERLATLDGTGTFVGEMSFFTGHPRTADVRAETDGKVLVVQDVEAFFQDDPRHAVAVAREMARRYEVLYKRFLELKRVATTPAPPPEAIDAVVRALTEDPDATMSWA